jgi:ribosomal subunit interface protein
MKITIKATNFKLTPSIENYVLEKIGSLEKFVEKLDATGVVECWVEVGKTTKHHQKGPVFRAEANIRLPKEILRAESCEKNLRTAIVKIKDELQRKIDNYKGKRSAEIKRGARIGKKILRFDSAALEMGEIDTSVRHREE